MNLTRALLVPSEMKPYLNWVCWGPGGNKQNKAPYSPVTGDLASVIDPLTWTSYDEACTYMRKYSFAGIGFMLSVHDPFAIIDLDNPQGDPNIVAQQEAIFRNFYSYSEISPNGQGLHIVVKGQIPRGRRRNKIEVYSQKRFMTMTGDVYRNIDIMSCQEELIKLYKSLGGTEEEAQILDERIFEVDDDETVYETAAKASNGEKFVDLWEGRWHQYYPHSVDPTDPDKGASEADFGLIDILAYYSDCKRQITRMFLDSHLGKRKKAKRDDYITYMLDECFDNKLPQVDLSYFQREMTEKLAEVNLEMENPKVTLKKEKKAAKLKKPSVYEFPPGLVGEIAKFIYSQAPRPVKEIALAGALGLMSGIVGKAYNVSNTGLNQYYLLLAETGRGKEAMALGIGSIMNEVKKFNSKFDDYLGPGEIASPQALIRYMDDGCKSFVSVLGEFGLVLKQMTMPSASPNLVGLRRLLLDLYNKSGEGQSVRPSVYSDRAKNTKSIIAPAISILGESTPSKFYEVLDETMIAEGWLPRWLCIEYRGKRVPQNYNAKNAKPSYELIQRVSSLCANCLTLNSQDGVIDIGFTPEGNKVQAQYNEFCDDQINNTVTPIRAELWNRAHLKAMKLAALVAVGINPIEPVICENSMNWAIHIINKDCINIMQRFDAGEIGGSADENLQIMKILEFMTKFVGTPWGKLSYSARGIQNCGLYHEQNIIPYAYLQKKCVGLKLFKEDRLGATNAIKKVIKTLIEMDEIALVSVPDRKRKFDSVSPCYIIKNLGIFEDAKRKGLI